MPQFAQTNAPAVSDGLLPALQDSSAERVMLHSIGKEGEGTEHLLKLIASLESCNAALLNKLVQAQRELATLRQPPGTKLADHHEQSCGWERKLTRTGWRPS